MEEIARCSGRADVGHGPQPAVPSDGWDRPFTRPDERNGPIRPSSRNALASGSIAAPCPGSGWENDRALLDLTEHQALPLGQDADRIRSGS